MFDIMVQCAEGKVKYCVQVQSHATLAAILCNEMFAIHIIIYIYIYIYMYACIVVCVFSVSKIMKDVGNREKEISYMCHL